MYIVIPNQSFVHTHTHIHVYWTTSGSRPHYKLNVTNPAYGTKLCVYVFNVYTHAPRRNVEDWSYSEKRQKKLSGKKNFSFCISFSYSFGSPSSFHRPSSIPSVRPSIPHPFTRSKRKIPSSTSRCAAKERYMYTYALGPKIISYTCVRNFHGEPPEKKALNQPELGSVFLLRKGNGTKKGIVIRIRVKRPSK